MVCCQLKDYGYLHHKTLAFGTSVFQGTSKLKGKRCFSVSVLFKNENTLEYGRKGCE